MFQSIVRKPILLFAAAVVCACLAIVAVASGASSNGFTTKGAWSFFSAPSLHPPKIRTDRPTVSGKLAPGYFMIANSKDLSSGKPMVGQGGPLILDSHLQPVWFKPVLLKVTKQGSTDIGTNATFNLREQTYNGHPVLSWWQGTATNTGDTLAGEDIVVNQHYNQVATLTAQGPTGCSGSACWVLSEHEFLITGHDAWVTAYRDVPMDLTKYGGPKNGTLIDTAVQEYDLLNGQQLFSWDALDHIPLSQSHEKPLSTGFWDAYHENSIGLANSTFLVSMRNTWAAYDVNKASGNILWTLSGDPKTSSFRLPASARFQWQHDVELHTGGIVSVFDDHCCDVVGTGKLVPPSGPASRGLLLKLNFSKHTAALVDRYTNGGFYLPLGGNVQLLPGGNVAVGWLEPFSEYTRSGTFLLDASLSPPDISYRAYVQRWVGLPLTATLSGAVRKSGAKTLVYASWNGATEVVAWRVLGGSSASHLSVSVSRAAKSGFETAITVPGSHKFFELEALNSRAHVIGASKTFSPSQPTLVGAY